MGGSWGVTLALAYAQSHPQSVAGLILRGVCLLRPQEIDWFYKKVNFGTGGSFLQLHILAWHC
jgi:pimeloyl-ACP methyl ester carboxylesterase